MLRVVFQNLLLFFLPWVLYGLYVVYARRRARLAGQAGPGFEHTPWFWLTVSGLLLAIAGFAYLAATGGAPPDSAYQPARVIDGKVVPGQTK